MPAPTIAPDEAYIQRLVALAQAGDDASFAELYRRHYAQGRSYLVGRLGDRFEAGDVAQEAFLTARAARGDYREAPEIPWGGGGVPPRRAGARAPPPPRPPGGLP